jgi:Domain of unknown function (DUF1963)
MKPGGKEELDRLIETCFEKLRLRITGNLPQPDSPAQVKLRTQKEQEAALQAASEMANSGNAQSAIDLFEALAKVGKPEAFSHLMLLYAYKHRWDKVLDSLESIVDLPELVWFSSADETLAARAALMIGARDRLFSIVKRQKSKMLRQRGAIPPVLKALEDFSLDRNSEERNKFFGRVSTKTKVPDELPQEYLDYSTGKQMRTCTWEGASWAAAEKVSRILIAQDSIDKAWDLLKKELPTWDALKVLLITEEDFIELMTTQRCDEVLSTPMSANYFKKTSLEKKPTPGEIFIKKKTLRLFPSSQPIKAPITKFGGQPVWIEQAQWPLSRSSGDPMSFICQIELVPEIFGATAAKMAYVFMSSDDSGKSNTGDSEAGDNAVIIQPGGEIYVQIDNLNDGPSFFEDYAVELIAGEDEPFSDSQLDADPEDDEESDLGEREVKIGGTPSFIQGNDYPAGDPSQWHLLIQLDEARIPEGPNFGMGCAYAFISKDGTKGRFTWQCY